MSANKNEKNENDTTRVLVTGASGYIASHVVKQLLEEGYIVRGTVRSLKDEKKIEPLRELCPEKSANLELVEADLTKSDVWTEVVKDCKFILHIASPFPNKPPRNPDDLIKPAVDGTLSVLKAAADSKFVKRVVVTSSVAAILFGHEDVSQTFTEENWSNVDSKRISPYEKSKTLAEKAAWDFVKDLSEDQKFELVTVNPGYVMGPMLHKSDCTSMEVIKRLLERSMPMVPRIGFPTVDVRDVARAHIKAMTMPELAGTRNIAVSRWMWFKEVADILATEFKPKGYNVPTKLAPYWMAWMSSLVDKSVKLVLPNWNLEFKVDNKRMTEVMGINPIDLKDTVIDMANSLIEKNLIKTPKAKKAPKAPKNKAEKNGATVPAVNGVDADEQQKVEVAPAPPSPRPIDEDDDEEDLKKPAKIEAENGPKIEQVAA